MKYNLPLFSISLLHNIQLHLNWLFIIVYRFEDDMDDLDFDKLMISLFC